MGLRDIDRHLPQDYWRVRHWRWPARTSNQDVHKWVLVKILAKARTVQDWLDSLH